MTLPVLVLGEPGQFLPNPSVVLVFWEDPNSSTQQFWTNHPDFVQAGTQFFIQFLRGYNVDRLSQYGVGIGQIVSVAIISTALSQSDPDFVADLIAKTITNGDLVSPDQYPNTVYVFIQDPTSDAVAAGAEGQHWLSTNTVPYSGGIAFTFLFCLMSDLQLEAANTPGMTGPQWWAASTLYTALLSHEIYETLTDPNAGQRLPNGLLPGWSYRGPDPATPPPYTIATSECCDLCDDRLNGGGTNVVPYGPWSVDYYWSNADKACVLGFQIAWTNLGTPAEANGAIQAVAVAQNAGPNANYFTSGQGALQVFATDAIGDLWTCSGNAPNAPGGVWAGANWTNLSWGNSLVAPVAAANATLGLLEIFAVSVPVKLGRVAIWHCYQTSPNGLWSAMESLGTPDATIVSNVSVGHNGPNLALQDYRGLELFVVCDDGQLHHIWNLGPWKGWSGWGDSLGAPPPGIAPIYSKNAGPGPCVATNRDGRLEVFLLGSDQNVWHRYKTAPNSVWSSWYSFPSLATSVGNASVSIANAPGSIACIPGQTQGLCLLALGTDGNVYYNQQQAGSKDSWSGWSALQPLNVGAALEFSSAITAVSYGDAYGDDTTQSQAFVIGSDYSLWTTQQGSTPLGQYQPWRYVGVPPTPTSSVGLDITSTLAAVGTRLGATVCAIGSDGNVWSVSQTGPYAPWGPLIFKTV